MQLKFWMQIGIWDWNISIWLIFSDWHKIKVKLLINEWHLYCQTIPLLLFLVIFSAFICNFVLFHSNHFKRYKTHFTGLSKYELKYDDWCKILCSESLLKWFDLKLMRHFCTRKTAFRYYTPIAKGTKK